MDGDPHLSCRRFRLRGSSVAASAGACRQLTQSHVVVVALIADECAVGGGDYEFATVHETGVTFRAEAELELCTLLVALSLGEVHEGHMS